MITDSQNYLLKVVGSFDSPIGASQIEKAVFLEEARSFPRAPHYTFHRFFYGPHSEEVGKDLESLIEAGQVFRDRKGEFTVYWTDIKATDYLEVAQVVQDNTKKSLKSFLESLYTAFEIMSLKMGTVIKFSPDMKVKADNFLLKMKK